MITLKKYCKETGLKPSLVKRWHKKYDGDFLTEIEGVEHVDVAGIEDWLRSDTRTTRQAKKRPVHQGETELYRFFSEDDELLYIGISLSSIGRSVQHGQAGWWPLASKMIIERHPSRQKAMEAERIAIKAEGPKFNIVHAEARDVAH